MLATAGTLVLPRTGKTTSHAALAKSRVKGDDREVLSRGRASRVSAVLLAALGLLPTSLLRSETIPVRHTEGLLHGFLVLQTVEGDIIADGDWIQTAHGDRVTNHLVFRFKDGSTHDETAVFRQRRSFRLLNAHLVQKGPSFPHPIEMTIDASAGQVTVHYGEEGKEKVATEHLKLPADVANGIVLTLLKNLPSGTSETKVSMVAATPKPRIVKLAISAEGEESFTTGATSRKAKRYLVKVEIGGLTGLVAPLLGKQPAETHVWILNGEAPAFIKSEGPLYLGGPIWRIELTSPTWPHIPMADVNSRY